MDKVKSTKAIRAMREFVSVVIPVYKDWPSLQQCLHALSKQAYPRERFEVIVVNNAPEEICPFEMPASNMILTEESRKGSYAARNAGIHAAKGSILAFTDADCQPDPGWIENGVRCLHENEASMVGGLIHFVFENPESASEMLDAATHMDNRRSIQKYKAAATANLFVKRHVFDTVGLFDKKLQSGGDITLTQKAHAAGFDIIFCQEARVNHPARRFKKMRQKLSRVAGGQLKLLRQMPVSFGKKTQLVFLHLVPLANPFRVSNTIREYGKSSVWLFIRVMLLSIFLGLAYDFFLLRSLLFSKRR